MEDNNVKKRHEDNTLDEITRDYNRSLKIWKSITAVLAIALIGTGTFGYMVNNEKNYYKTYLQNQYQRAFRDMVSDVENLKILLDKAEVTGSHIQSNSLMNQIWKNGYSAAESLSEIPISQGVLEKTHKFLNQVSDFSLSISRQNASDKMMTEEQLNLLSQLNKLADGLVNELRAMQTSINEGKIKFGEITQKGNFFLKKAAGNALDSEFGKLEKGFSEYPSMIYDGPFSDNVIEGKPKGLEKEEDVNMETAKERAKKFVGSQRVGRIVEASSGKGRINTFGLEVIPKDGDRSKSIFIDVTKKGGHVLWMLDQRAVGQKKLTDDEAIEKAKNFLKEQGFGNLTSTYHYKNDNTITVTFVGIEGDGVLVYPDQMKVKIALDNGDIVGFDAYPYLMAHHDRNMLKPSITEAEAREKVNKKIEINRVKLAIIPLPGDKEQLCYEFKGTYNGNDYFVYINAENGNEENILRVIKEENGILTQ
ncbi:germination protein YpeB [Lutispora thermophila]|uniref:Spore germination protein n=1 Tax=Lutispora thermophila DSM 19022 TaxID=1122184 RepID=A0A1M6BU91_9FIRM|nr:germination protein YpeB [Lutispora thermophila]SHI52299.1 spore germination protein [Lutispora thermophila DSM 19022]